MYLRINGFDSGKHLMQLKTNRCDFGKLIFDIVDEVKSKQIHLWRISFWILQYDVVENEQIRF